MPPVDPAVAAAIGHLRRARARLPGGRAAPVVVGVSGGADSVALAGLLVKTLEPGDGLVHLAHVDHGLRATSAAEARGVLALGQSLGCACTVRTLALAQGPGLPARARAARSAALWSVADEVGADVVALAHTATDQAETVLLHLCRGAGLAGLSGMRTITAAVGRAGGRVWRPLLHLDRATARGVCTTLGLAFVDDPTNADVAAPRTKIRHEVLPVLRTIRDGVDVAFARAAEAAAEADDALAQWCEAQLRSRRIDAGPGDEADGVTATWSTDDWSTMPVAIRLRLIQRMCTEAGVPVDGLAARTIRSIDATLCRTGEAHAWDLHPSVRVEAHAGQLRVHARGAESRGPNH